MFELEEDYNQCIEFNYESMFDGYLDNNLYSEVYYD